MNWSKLWAAVNVAFCVSLLGYSVGRFVQKCDPVLIPPVLTSRREASRAVRAWKALNRQR